MTANPCAESRLSLGAYVVGALDPSDRSRVDAHLATCVGCREELAAFAGLPGLLGRVSIAEVEVAPEPPSPELLQRLLTAVARERRRDRRVRWLAVSAAAVVVAAAASVTGLAVNASHHSTTPATENAATFTATDPVTHVTASVVEWPKAWGAALEVKIDTAQLAGQVAGYANGVDRCQLVAVAANGTKDVAASWSATSSGNIVAQGATAFATADIASFEVMSGNKMLVSIPAHSASS
jgi:predicted anti-sigma-YlaC factor YlaD